VCMKSVAWRACIYFSVATASTCCGTIAYTIFHPPPSPTSHQTNTQTKPPPTTTTPSHFIPMSSTTSPIPYITRETLSTLLLTQEPTTPSPSAPPKKLAIIDVRDADHVGGHIRTSRHHPSSTLATYLPTLVRTLHEDGVDVVVFHCALSQVRGPSAARSYVRERGRLLGGAGGGGGGGQEVFVLKGGFVGWQEL